jgi:hypothetical protein
MLTKAFLQRVDMNLSSNIEGFVKQAQEKEQTFADTNERATSFINNQAMGSTFNGRGFEILIM